MSEQLTLDELTRAKDAERRLADWRCRDCAHYRYECVCLRWRVRVLEEDDACVAFYPAALNP